MSKHTQAPPVVRKVWRMSATAPQGEIVSTGPAAKPAPAASDEGSCWQSSAELENGASVTEYVWDHYPPEVLAVYRKN